MAAIFEVFWGPWGVKIDPQTVPGGVKIELWRVPGGFWKPLGTSGGSWSRLGRLLGPNGSHFGTLFGSLFGLDFEIDC